MDDDEQREMRAAFDEAVNMTAKELERWLQSDESTSVGDSSGRAESTGHEMGRYLVELRGKHVADYDDEDYRRMRKVTSRPALPRIPLTEPVLITELPSPRCGERGFGRLPEDDFVGHFAGDVDPVTARVCTRPSSRSR